VTILLDTHVVHWWSAEPHRLSRAATDAVEAADELAVAAITWFELAWLAANDRIVVGIPVRSWLAGLSAQLRTVALTPEVAVTATTLGTPFPGDPADRLIYATAIEHGCQLVTKDGGLRRYRHPRPITVW
jgi:PIN domain nuclease of toxin-antitoxin system